MQKRFSVIIATYNRERYLRQAIESVLAQTFSDYELIVVDDGSTDGTAALLESFGSRLKVVRQENQGSEMAYKAGVSRASGEYLAFLDSDDFFLPAAFASYDTIITALGSPPLIVGAMECFTDEARVPSAGENGEDIEVFTYRDYLSKDIAIGLAQSRIVMRKALFDEVQAGTGKPLARNLNDYRLILRAGTYGPCIIVSRPVTLAYRYHEMQSSKNIAKMCQGVLYMIRLARSRQERSKRAALLDRYAYMGGLVREWSRKALKTGLPIQAFKIVLAGFPMLAAVLIRKTVLAFRTRTAPVIIKSTSGVRQERSKASVTGSIFKHETASRTVAPYRPVC